MTQCYRARDRPCHSYLLMYKRTPSNLYMKGYISNMKILKKLFASCLAVMMIISCIPSVYAVDIGPAEPQAPSLIDSSAVGSLTIYKYDTTNGATRS